MVTNRGCSPASSFSLSLSSKFSLSGYSFLAEFAHLNIWSSTIGFLSAFWESQLGRCGASARSLFDFMVLARSVPGFVGETEICLFFLFILVLS